MFYTLRSPKCYFNFTIQYLSKMQTEGYKIKDQSKPHFVTFTVVAWIDVFTRKRYKDTIIESLQYCIEHKGMIVFGYVIMSNHIHMIIQSDSNDLSGLIRDFKKHTAKTIIDQIQSEPESRREWMLDLFQKATVTHNRNKEFQFWKYGNHPEEIYSQKFLWSKLDYIHLNPIRSGLVNKASHYCYSSASNYVDKIGILEISLADNPVVNVHSDNDFWKSIVW